MENKTTISKVKLSMNGNESRRANQNENKENAACNFIQLTEHDDPSLSRSELLAGLTAEKAMISPKFLYDALGSKLFEAICMLPEYYLTRTEKLIFEQFAIEIAQTAGTNSILIDLGAGNCAKAKSLFPYLKPRQYVPIDISIDFLRDAVNDLQQQFPQIQMIGLGMDFSNHLDLPIVLNRSERLFFWPGSSISNFAPVDAFMFLRRVHAQCVQDGAAEGGLLISADLVKDTDILNAAYDDALGVTAAFNLNGLLQVNRLIGADFDLSKWQHRGLFNPEYGRIEMHLEAKMSHTVHWSQGERDFEEGERIHTESSYKYTRVEFVDLLEEAGFVDVKCWTDPQEWFMVCYAKARSAPSGNSTPDRGL